MNELQQRSTGNNGTVSNISRRDARYLAAALMLSKECEALNAFRTKADSIALGYTVPNVIMQFSANSEARALSARCRNKDEREILATAFDEVAGVYNAGSRENGFLQEVAAGIRSPERF